jgi:hypothetical protein
MTDVGEPGPLPEELIGLASDSLEDLSWTDEFLGYRGDGFFQVDDVVVPPAVSHDELVAAIKEEAERRILIIMPEPDQRFTFALGFDLLFNYGLDTATWPAEDQAIYAAVMPLWADIRAVRTARDAIIGSIPGDAPGRAAFDVAANPGWPA